MTASTIEQVVEALTAIIDECWHLNSRLGYFPAMYRKVTLQIGEGVRLGRFKDGQRLERLDVVFANRYLAAYEQVRRGERPAWAWAYAFEMAERSEPMVVQHLLLGMNAHINLDLAVAAAEVCREEDLEGLEADFFEVNQVLASVLDEIQAGVNDASTLYRALDRLGWRIDEALCNFSIRHARRAAWRKARRLHGLPESLLADQIDEIDREVAALARLICPAGALGNALHESISDTELQEPRRIIEELL